MVEFLITLPLVWFIICMYFTLKHRNKILEDIFYNPVVYFNYKKISYEQHLFKLLTFRWKWRRWYYESK